MAFLDGMTVAAGIAAINRIAAINGIASLAGVVSPSLVGWRNDITGRQQADLIFTSSALWIGAEMLLPLPAETMFASPLEEAQSFLRFLSRMANRISP